MNKRISLFVCLLVVLAIVAMLGGCQLVAGGLHGAGDATLWMQGKIDNGWKAK